MQLPLIGPSYEHPSRDANYQKCINLFLSPSGPMGRGEQKGDNQSYCLLPTPGLFELVDLTGSKVRSIMVYNDSNVYAVVDDTVYKLTIDYQLKTASGASVGTLNSSSGYISWAKNPTQIIIVDGTYGYILTVSTDTLTEITDTDFTGADTVVFFDSYFFYNTPNAATMYATALNDGSSIDALDVATAEGKPDLLVGLAADKRELWAFGEESIEVWYNAANATGFPLSRREGAYIDIGCGAKGSILNVDNTLIWLDNRGYVVSANGYSPQVLSTPAISHAIQSYQTVSDAVAISYTDRGHLFYALSFPTEKVTWCYDLTTKNWHQLAYWDKVEDAFTHHLFNCHDKYKQWELIGDRASGKIYIMSGDYYDNNGEAIHRVRTTGHNQMEFNQIGVSCIELHVDTGDAPQGTDPKIMMRYSNDGGRTWSNEITRDLGKVGEFKKRIRWNRLGSGSEWMFEFKVTDALKFSIIDAAAYIEGGFAG